VSAPQLFFDDHVMPHDGHILDVRRASEPAAPSFPVAAVLGINIFRAEPLRSIAERSYFMDAVSRAEVSWRAAWRQRYALAEALMSLHSLSSLSRAGSDLGVVAAGRYVPHSATAAVLRASDAHTFDADE
jgi:hypothetical protein